MQDVALDANGQWIKCVLNAKNIVFHMTFGKYPNLGTSENFQKFFLSKFVFFKEFFLTKMFFLTIFFQRIFHCFQDHYTILK